MLIVYIMHYMLNFPPKPNFIYLLKQKKLAALAINNINN